MTEENKPFNDVIDHSNKITGNATNPANAKLSQLPKPIKFIGYFIIGFITITTLFSIILTLLK